MKNRKFKIHPQYFLFMVFSAIGGLILVFFGITTGNTDPLSMGGFFLLIALILFGLQWVRIPALGEEVNAEIDRLFPAEAKKKVLVLLTNGFTDYRNDGVYLSMLRFSKGDLQRLKKLSRSLHGQEDFREAYPMLEHINRKLDESEPH